MVLQLLHPALLLVFSVLVTCARREKGEYCTLGGERYEMGQTWHPTLAPFGRKKCINCTCYEGGEVKCQKIGCPRPNCEVPKILPGDCCPTCDVGKEGPREKEAERPGCEHEGRAYNDGDLFVSNTTGIRPTRMDQCVICHCAMGVVLCQLKTCLPTKCKKFKSVPDDCCPQCADEADYTEEYLHYVLSDPKQDNRTDADCTSPMGVRKNGSSWKPIIGEYQEEECVLCTCLNGNVTCKRLDCPDEASLPCKRPRRVQGSCCKECVPSKRRKGRPHGHRDKPADSEAEQQEADSAVGVSGNAAGIPESADADGRGHKGKSRRKGSSSRRNENNKKRGKGKNRKKNRRRKNKEHNHRKCKSSDREQVHPDRKANVTSVAAIFSELCLPRRMDRIVYRVKGGNYDLLAFDAVTDPSVEMLRWNVADGKSQAVERTILVAADFRATVSCDQIIGATNKRGFKKLLKKVESKTRRCKSKKRRCVTKALDKVLKRDRRLKPLPTQRVCGE